MFATIGVVYGSWQILQSGARDECKARAIREHNESHGGEVGICRAEWAEKIHNMSVEDVLCQPMPSYISAFKLLQE